MTTDAEHRKKVKHYDIPGDSHLLTFSCYRPCRSCRKLGRVSGLWSLWPSLGRSTFVRAGLRAAGGLSLPGLLRAEAAAEFEHLKSTDGSG